MRICVRESEYIFNMEIHSNGINKKLDEEYEVGNIDLWFAVTNVPENIQYTTDNELYVLK